MHLTYCEQFSEPMPCLSCAYSEQMRVVTSLPKVYFGVILAIKCLNCEICMKKWFMRENFVFKFSFWEYKIQGS